jgi:hypothetical protein
MKPLACLSMDIDNQWSYMKTHGDSGWEKFPSYLDLIIPRVLSILDQLNIKVTFFVVGQDAALDKNRDALKLLTERGHEVGNHSFHHEPWLNFYPRDQIRREIIETEEQILRVTGQKPIGFRGPGFAWSADLIEVLAENEYLYDSSILPTYIAPLARAYYFWTSSLTREEKIQRKKMFGSLKTAIRPVKPFLWHLDSNETLLEIPITTVPIIKMPFHLSYLLYFSRFSTPLMLLYLKIALTMCRITHTALNFLLHPLDFVSRDEIPDLAFFPGMDLETSRKIELFKNVMGILYERFEFVKMSTLAKNKLNSNKTKMLNL